MIIPLNNSVPVTDEKGLMSLPLFQWQQAVSKLGLIIGTGSPETVESADQGRIYMDDAGTAGNILYIKRDTDISGDTKKGWILI